MAASKAASATALPAHAPSPSAAGPWPVQGAARGGISRWPQGLRGGSAPAGRRAAGHRSFGGARRPLWRLWRRSARRPPAAHAGDGEGGGGALESGGSTPKGQAAAAGGRKSRGGCSAPDERHGNRPCEPDERGNRPCDSPGKG